MDKNKVISMVLILISIVLAVVSYILLPETVVTQISAGGSNTTMPKLGAIAIPFVLTIGGGVFSLFKVEDDRNWRKGILVSIIGIIIFGIMLFVNLF